MTKYEYDYLVFDDLHLKDAIDHCNEMGKDGWELVSHSVYSDSNDTEMRSNVYHYYYFKRQL